MPAFDLPTGKDGPGSAPRRQPMSDEMRRNVLRQFTESTDRFEKAQVAALVTRLNVTGAQLKDRWVKGVEDPNLLKQFNEIFANIFHLDSDHAYRILQAAQLLDFTGRFVRRPLGAFVLSFDGTNVRVERSVAAPRGVPTKKPLVTPRTSDHPVQIEMNAIKADLRKQLEMLLPASEDHPDYVKMKGKMDELLPIIDALMDGVADIIIKHPEGLAELGRVADTKIKAFVLSAKEPGKASAMLRTFAVDGSFGSDARSLLMELADFVDAQFPPRPKQPKKK